MTHSRLCQILTLVAALGLAAQTANAAGTIPFAWSIQADSFGNAMPGCLLYSYVAGTVATPQNSYQDVGLSLPNPNPVSCDQGSRLPALWYTDGLVHVRLTTAAGTVVVDTTMQTVGPSSGGGGGGGTPTIDPSTIAQTGDIKFRLSSEGVVGWVKLNGTTIGNGSSGASQLADNTLTSALFTYLWNNCSDLHCPLLPTGGGGTAIKRGTSPSTNPTADFNSGLVMTLPDLRDKAMAGLDCMANGGCLGGLLASNITSGGTDGVDTPGASGGLANITITIDQAHLPAYNLKITEPNGGAGHSHADPGGGNFAVLGGSGTISGNNVQSGINPLRITPITTNATTGIAVNLNGGGKSFTNTNMPPFILGTFFMKL